VYSDSGGAHVIAYDWFELETIPLGWFDDDQTSVPWTGYHCLLWAGGKPQLYNEVDGGVLKRHGGAIRRCLQGDFDGN